MRLKHCILPLLVLLISAPLIHWRLKKSNHDRCAAEGEATVVQFLKDGGAFTNKGKFLAIHGEGYIYPVWNIQGYEFIDLHRTADFSNGAQPLRIIVREGRTPDGKIRQPVLEPYMDSQRPLIFVTHPGFRP